VASSIFKWNLIYIFTGRVLRCWTGWYCEF